MYIHTYRQLIYVKIIFFSKKKDLQGNKPLDIPAVFRSTQPCNDNRATSSMCYQEAEGGEEEGVFIFSLNLDSLLLSIICIVKICIV